MNDENGDGVFTMYGPQRVVMRPTAVGVGLLVGIAVLAVAAMGGVVADTTDNESDTREPLGAEMSGFMGASAAETEGEVDDGMFNAALNRTDDPEERRALIEQRQQRLEERHDRLAEQRRGLSESEATVRDRAVAARVNAGAVALERSVNGTERAAEAAGADTGRLNELRRNARQLRGPEVADLARGIAGPPDGAERGPPGDDDEPGPQDTNAGEQDSDARETEQEETSDRGDGGDGGQGPPSNGGPGQSGGDSGPPGASDGGQSGSSDR